MATTCTTENLNAHVVDPQGAAGHGGQVVVLTNFSGTTCSTGQYPGVGLLDAAGRPEPLTVVRATDGGFLYPGVANGSVTLAPGDKASFWMEWINVNGSLTGSLQVTPPNDTDQLVLPNETVPLNVGTITVSPVTPGIIGTDQSG